jgi:hypothetical protein
MLDVKRIQELAGAAGYLCSAAEELSAAGYEVWGDELKALVDIIAAEISLLQTHDVKGVV